MIQIHLPERERGGLKYVGVQWNAEGEGASICLLFMVWVYELYCTNTSNINNVTETKGRISLINIQGGGVFSSSRDKPSSGPKTLPPPHPTTRCFGKKCTKKVLR